jgi:hypothetical protein
MEVLPTLKDESIDISVYSPPFPELYQYSDNPRDMSNCVNYNETLDHYRHIVKEIVRVTKAGRLSCVHCCDLKRGQLYQYDFPGDVIRIHEEYGLRYFCRIAIWKDPWEFARRTRMRTLQHRQIVEDSSCSRVAPADHMCVFLKPGDSVVPITHEHGFNHYAGATLVPAKLREYVNYRGDQRKNLLSHWIYRQYASPVWMDVRRGKIMPHDDERENPEEKHVCPLQLDVIERCLSLWSNPGDVMLTPFMGIGSEVFQAVRMKRRGIGIELKPTYYRQAAHNLVRLATLEMEPTDFELTAEDPQKDDDYFANILQCEESDDDTGRDVRDLPAPEEKTVSRSRGRRA